MSEAPAEATPLDVVARLGTDIDETFDETFTAYLAAHRKLGRIRLANARAPPPSHQFGPTPRLSLDVYTPEKYQPRTKHPIIVFLYGGGLVDGGKGAPGGLLWQNFGHTLAGRGFVTIIPEYRLVGKDKDGAQYPSGAEDLALALEWVAAGHVPTADLSNVFLLANSAGGVHLATFLYAPRSEAFRRLSDLPLKCRGVIYTSVTFDFDEAPGDWPVVDEFYTSRSAWLAKQPRALRAGSDDSTPTLLVQAEKDPEDVILAPTRRFRALFNEGCKLAHLDKPDLITVPHHNHVSLMLAVGLGGREDAWLDAVVEWMKRRMVD